MWQSAIRLLQRLLRPLVPDRLRDWRRRRLAAGPARRRGQIAPAVSPEVLAGLTAEIPPDTAAALSLLGRTEDVRFSPSGGRLALAGFYADRVLVLETRIVPSGDTHKVIVDGHTMVTSPGFRHPHGLAFLDDTTLVVASRFGRVAVLPLPPPATGSNEVRLDPVATFRGTLLRLRFNPGSVDVLESEPGRFRALVCSNYSDSVTSHALDTGRGFAARYEGVVAGRGLSTPDGISVSPDRKWIAVSNHDDGTVLIFENLPGSGRRTRAAGILRGLVTPHGLRFTPDQRHIVVADAGGPWVQVFASADGRWEGERTVAAVVRIMDQATFEAGLAIPSDGGPKGITIDGSGRVMATSCELQLLAFFDLQRVLGRTGNVRQV